MPLPWLRVGAWCGVGCWVGVGLGWRVSMGQIIQSEDGGSSRGVSLDVLEEESRAEESTRDHRAARSRVVEMENAGRGHVGQEVWMDEKRGRGVWTIFGGACG